MAVRVATPPKAAPARTPAPQPATAPAKAAAPPKVPSLEELQRTEKAATLVMAARMQQRRGQKEAVRASLREALQLVPTDVGALEVLGDLYLEEGEQAKAIAVFEKGLSHHPQHLAFEEKIAVAKLDLAEMETDRIRRELFLQQGDTEKWQDKNPGLAGSLSLILPGAGQVYNDEYERGAIMLGAALVSFIAWFWPLTSAMSRVTQSLSPGINLPLGDIVSRGFGELGGASILVYLMLAVWLATYVYSAWDAAQLAINAAEARKRNMGIV